MKTREILPAKEIEIETITEEQYDEMLDEEGPIHIGSLKFDRSQILKELDPIAYNCGLSDIQEYETHYECPICGENHGDDEEAAIFCCQEEESEEEETED